MGVLRRSPLKRGTRRLSRGPALVRRVRMRLRNPERLARRREVDTCPAHAARLRSRACDECGISPEPRRRSHNSHVKTKGSGGRWWEQVTHCWLCHLQFESHTIVSRHTRAGLLRLALRLAWESHDLGRAPAPPLPRPGAAA